MYTLLYLKWITNMVLLVDRVVCLDLCGSLREESLGEWIHNICTAESLCCRPKISQHC